MVDGICRDQRKPVTKDKRTLAHVAQGGLKCLAVSPIIPSCPLLTNLRASSQAIDALQR